VAASHTAERALRSGKLAAERLGGLAALELPLVRGELGRLGSFALPGGAALTLPLRPLDRFAERGHEVDDLPVLGFLARLRDPTRLRLLVQQRQQLLAIGVVVLRGIERVAEVLDERPRHLALG